MLVQLEDLLFEMKFQPVWLLVLETLIEVELSEMTDGVSQLVDESQLVDVSLVADVSHVVDVAHAVVVAHAVGPQVVISELV